MIKKIFSGALLLGCSIGYSNQISPIKPNESEVNPSTSQPILFTYITTLVNSLPTAKDNNTSLLYLFNNWRIEEELKNQLLAAFNPHVAVVGANAIAIGNSSNAYNDNDIAIGYTATAGISSSTTPQNNIALGALSTASGGNSAAIGYSAVASGVNSLAFGSNATASGIYSLALGGNATANNSYSVALGYGSSTAATVATSSTTLNGTVYNFAGTTPASTVSIGTVGSERTLTNLAAGRISGTSTDAVNGSQLFASNTAINSLGINLNFLGAGVASSLGGGAAYDSATGQFTAPTYTVSGTNYNDVGSALNAIQSSVSPSTKYFNVNSTLADSTASGTNSIAIGPVAVVTGSNATALGNGATASNANDVALGSGSTTAATVATSSTTLNGTVYNFAGTTPTSTVSIGTVGGERTLTNVAAGRISGTSTDAVNGSQLFATNQAVIALGASGSASVTAMGNNLATLFGGNINYNPATNNFSGQFTYNSNQYNSIQDVFNAISSSGPGPASTPYYSTDDGGVHGGNYNSDGATAKGALAAGVNARASGVESTAVGVSTQASAQGSVAVGANAQAAANNSIAIGNGAVSRTTNSVALGSNSTAERDNTVSIGSSGNERQLIHVAAGTAATDAVNVGQMNSVINSKVNEVKDWSKNYTDQRFNRANAGVAAAIAASGIPQAYMPDKSSAGIALGTYQGQIGVAMGLSTISPNGRYVFKVNGTTSSLGDLGGSAGVALIW